MKPHPFIVAALIIPAAATAADPPPVPCTSEQHRQFDFWIGKWKVTMQGQVAGENDIQPILGGCALLENWTGAKGLAGKSVNFFDRVDGLWHQTWVDASGGALHLSGRFADGAMRLAGERPATARQPATRHRITWTPQAGGKVRQLWESSPVDREEWKVQFDGLYEPAGS